MSKKVLGIIILGMIVVANLYANGIKKDTVKRTSVVERVGEIFDYQTGIRNNSKVEDLTDVSHDNVEFMLKKIK